MTLLLGCIADDFTGATDLANTLVKSDLRTVQLIGLPADAKPIPDAEAVVIALKSRSIPPGDLDLARAVREMAGKHHAVLLANHGPVVAGKSLHDAVYATEELEETARLFLLLKGMNTRLLSADQVAALKTRFPA